MALLAQILSYPRKGVRSFFAVVSADENNCTRLIQCGHLPHIISRLQQTIKRMIASNSLPLRCRKGALARLQPAIPVDCRASLAQVTKNQTRQSGTFPHRPPRLDQVLEVTLDLSINIDRIERQLDIR